MMVNHSAEPVTIPHTWTVVAALNEIAACSVCGGVDDALLDSCPGVPLTPEQHEWNKQGNLRRVRKLLRAGGL